MVYGKVKDEVGMASLILAGLNSRPALEFMGHRTTFPMETILMLDIRSSLWKNLAYCRTGSVKKRKTGSEVIVLREAWPRNYTPEHKEKTTLLFKEEGKTNYEFSYGRTTPNISTNSTNIASFTHTVF